MLRPAEVCFLEVGGSHVNPGPQRYVFPQTHSDLGIPVRRRAENSKPLKHNHVSGMANPSVGALVALSSLR